MLLNKINKDIFYSFYFSAFQRKKIRGKEKKKSIRDKTKVKII